MEIQLILWTCCFPVMWSLVEYIDDKRLKMIGKETHEENAAFDDAMFGIFLLGYFAILQFN